MNWYVGVLKNYVGFSGRARRQEYWMFALFNTIIEVVLYGIDTAIGVQVLSTIYMLAVLLPSLAVAFRRLHDTDRSGGWLLIAFIPFIGAIILLIFLATAGSAGTNRYGHDPKQAAPVGY